MLSALKKSLEILFGGGEGKADPSFEKTVVQRSKKTLFEVALKLLGSKCEDMALVFPFYPEVSGKRDTAVSPPLRGVGCVRKDKTDPDHFFTLPCLPNPKYAKNYRLFVELFCETTQMSKLA